MQQEKQKVFQINSKQEKMIRYGLYFGLPVIMMTIVFAMLKWSPFGNSSILTWDMGEQYVDFFAFYRDTLLHHPSQFLYAFTNGIGGETLGLWAYYLLSPFNLILLFFPKNVLPIGILLMTLLKYGCAGLAFGYCLEKMKWTVSKWIPTATVCYTLMGWILSNEFNIMWLDVLVFLPFILYGIERIFTTERSFYYTIFLALMLLINFYMGYMVCIFVVFYFIWTAVRHWNGWKDFGLKSVRFGISSLLAAGSIAFLLLPTYFDITKSKGVYTQHNVEKTFEYAPWKMLSKFMIGTLNDGQIQAGYPNLFVGAVILAGFILYFLARQIPWREKITAGVITIFLGLSLCWQPFDIMWHAFQPPVDYPYRFSFIVTIWMILLALRGFTKLDKVRIYQLTFAYLIPLSCWVIVFVFRTKEMDYLTVPNMIATLIFMVLIFAVMTIMLLGWKKQFGPISLQRLAEIALLVLIVGECGMNSYQTVKSLGGAAENSYTDFVANLDQNVAWITKQESKNNFYRIGKTFQRSENDSLNAGYCGMSGFTSTQNAAVTSFMNSMGQPNYLGKENYLEGTLLIDAVMGVKYFMAPTDQFNNLVNSNIMTPASSYRPDVSFYGVVKRINGVTIYRNPLALSVGYAAKSAVLSNNDFPSADYTVDNQSYLLNTIGGTQENFFDFVGYHIRAINCRLNGGANGYLETIDKDHPSSYEIILKDVSAAPYYIQLTTDVMWNATVTINGNPMPGIGNASQPLLFNVCANSPHQDIKIKITPNDGKTINLNNLQLYRLNLEKFQDATNQLLANQLKLSHYGKLNLRGNITIPEDKSVMMTTIPYNKGWSVTVDGQKVKAQKAFKTFLAVPMSSGRHHVTLSFWPPLLTQGIVVSVIVWLILAGCWWYERKIKDE